MAVTDIAKLRLINQHIAGTVLETPEDMVGWMGAMQAQDYGMAKWGLGVRLPGSTEYEVEEAINDGRILRTHILRPTWHLVAATDLAWMMNLTGPRIKSGLNGNNKRLGLTEEDLAKSNKIISKALAKGEHLTRPELMAVLEGKGINTYDLRSAHIMYRAELDGIAVSGVRKGKELTYAPYDSRVPKPNIVQRDEAVGELWSRYFTSHGPATLADFVWWSGLTLADARLGLELNKGKFDSLVIEGQAYYFAGATSAAKAARQSVHLLPAFDEYLVSYKDRTASLHVDHFSKAITNNGIFYPVLVVNGKVIGSWKRTVKKDKTIVSIELFEAGYATDNAAIAKAVAALGMFSGQKAELV